MKKIERWYRPIVVNRTNPKIEYNPHWVVTTKKSKAIEWLSHRTKVFNKDYYVFKLITETTKTEYL